MKETSELLRKTRMEKHLSLEEISAQTKIQLHILRALEEGQLDEFRSPTYTRGFLRQYAKALGLDSDNILRLFEQETNSANSQQQKTVPVAKVDDNEIQNKTNVLWFRTSSKLLTLGGIVVIFSLVTAIYFFSMKLVSYSNETRSEATHHGSPIGESNINQKDSPLSATPSTPAEANLPKEESLSLPQANPVSTANVADKKQETKAEANRPKMVTLEAFENVDIHAIWSTGKKEQISLKTNGKHIFYYADKLKLEISNGGGVGVSTHEKDLGIPGELGKPKTLNFE